MNRQVLFLFLVPNEQPKDVVEQLDAELSSDGDGADGGGGAGGVEPAHAPVDEGHTAILPQPTIPLTTSCTKKCYAGQMMTTSNDSATLA